MFSFLFKGTNWHAEPLWSQGWTVTLTSHQGRQFVYIGFEVECARSACVLADRINAHALENPGFTPNPRHWTEAA